MPETGPQQLPQVTTVVATVESAKELEWFVKSIEEASKHGREVVLVLLATSFYVLLAVFANRANDSVPLPLLSISVSNNVFLWVGPLLVLVPYLYLQVCVRDLKQRLRTFEALPLELSYATERTMLLYPSLLTLGLSKKTKMLGSRSGAEPVRVAVAYDLPLFVASVSVVWCLAPAILLSLWGTFIGRQQPESLVPCVALITVIYGTSSGGGRSRVAGLVKALLAGILLCISIASIPALRHSQYLEATWHIAQRFGGLLKKDVGFVSSVAAAVATLSLTLGSGLSRISRGDNERFREALERRWVEVSDGKGIRNAVKARVLWTLLRFNISLRQALLTGFLFILSTTFAFMWLSRNAPVVDVGPGPAPPPCPDYPNCKFPTP